MYKTKRGNPLTQRQKLFNKLVTKKHFVIERCFGTIKQKLQVRRASYIGAVKVKA